MATATARVIGERALLRNLSALERRLAPSAMKNTLNKAQTRTRNQVIEDATTANPRRPKSQIKKWVRKGQRASNVKMSAEVVRATPRSANRPTAKGVPVSRPFVVESLNGHTYVRGLRANAGYRGKGRSADRTQRDGRRPKTSPPNLPIFRVGESGRSRDRIEARKAYSKRVEQTLKRSLLKAADDQVRDFVPGEFRSQLAKRVASIKARKRSR